MGRSEEADGVRDRVASYRTRSERQGLQRVETTVSSEDARLIKDVAKLLRESGPRADELRHAIRSIVPPSRARTGEELLAFFRRSPLVVDARDGLPPERDRSAGRDVDFDR